MQPDDQLDLWTTPDTAPNVADEPPMLQKAHRTDPPQRRRAPTRTHEDDVAELARLRDLRRRDPRNDEIRFRVAHLASRVEGVERT